MNPLFALLADVQAFLTDAAPEIRERCTDTTHQKLQGLLVQLEPVADQAAFDATFADIPSSEAQSLYPGGPTIGELLPRLFSIFEKQEAAADAREKVTADLVKSMEKIAVLMFDTGTPAA